jgi:hypothetical protein
MQAAAIGFRAKTGRAIAVVLSITDGVPEFILRREVHLSNPKIAATFQPHHQVMELPWHEARRAVWPAERSIEKIARSVIGDLARELKRDGFEIKAVGAVGSPDRDLAKIGNFHIRAHAAEGILFRRALESAAEKLELPWRSFSDRDLLQTGGAQLHLADRDVDSILKTMGKAAGTPWRADERMAAIAAWLALSA